PRTAGASRRAAHQTAADPDRVPQLSAEAPARGQGAGAGAEGGPGGAAGADGGGPELSAEDADVGSGAAGRDESSEELRRGQRGAVPAPPADPGRADEERRRQDDAGANRAASGAGAGAAGGPGRLLEAGHRPHVLRVEDRRPRDGHHAAE